MSNVLLSRLMFATGPTCAQNFKAQYRAQLKTDTVDKIPELSKIYMQ